MVANLKQHQRRYVNIKSSTTLHYYVIKGILYLIALITRALHRCDAAELNLIGVHSQLLAIFSVDLNRLLKLIIFSEPGLDQFKKIPSTVKSSSTRYLILLSGEYKMTQFIEQKRSKLSKIIFTNRLSRHDIYQIYIYTRISQFVNAI